MTAEGVQVVGDTDKSLGRPKKLGGHSGEMVVGCSEPAAALLGVAAQETVEAAEDPEEEESQLSFLALRVDGPGAAGEAGDGGRADSEDGGDLPVREAQARRRALQRLGEDGRSRRKRFGEGEHRHLKFYGRFSAVAIQSGRSLALRAERGRTTAAPGRPPSTTSRRSRSAPSRWLRRGSPAEAPGTLSACASGSERHAEAGRGVEGGMDQPRSEDRAGLDSQPTQEVGAGEEDDEIAPHLRGQKRYRQVG